MQLTRLRLVYCEYGGSSRNLREYISSGRVVEWARQHPHVEVEVHVRNGKHPLVEGEYRTGSPKQITVKNESLGTIQGVIQKLYNSSGRKMTKLKRPVMTQTPSIQGVWTPMLDLRQDSSLFSVEFVENHENEDSTTLQQKQQEL